ncbi:MAG: hypothetical protein R3Y59_07775 [bacterium]
MNTLNLSAYGVVAMPKQEMKETDGGNLLAFITVMGAIIYLYNEGDDLVDGFKEGYEGTRNKKTEEATNG